ncbi:MAG: acyl-CoA thioesterase [bacterium]|nr:acyl-CoA thioesterase [bacterium]
MSAARFAQTFHVRWADLDPNRHMRNTAYLDYATEVRFAYLAENGFPQARFAEDNFGPVIFREEIRS